MTSRALEEIRQLLAEQAAGGGVGDQRRPGDEGNPKLLDGEVEGDRHALIDAVADAEAVGFGGDADEIADRGMRDGDALRPARGAGGVEHIADRLRRGAALLVVERRIGLRGDLVARAVEHDERQGAGEAVGEALVGDGEPACRVVEDIGEPVSGMVGVDRHVGRARLQQAEQRDIGIEPAVEQHGDAVAGRDAKGAKMPRHLVGARVEFGERDIEAVERDGDASGMAAAGVLDHVLEPLAVAPAQHVAVAEDRQRRLRRPRERAGRPAFRRLSAAIRSGVGERHLASVP